MNNPAYKPRVEGEPRVGSVAAQSLHLIGLAVSFATFVVLRLAAPLVRLALTTLALLSILVALFYRLASSPPRSPFWLLLGFGFSCGVALILYEQLLRVLSAGRRS